MASFVLAAIFTMAWLSSVEDLRPRWWLVPLTWLWACTHGMWFVGVLIGTVVVLGLAIDGRLTPRSGVMLGSIPIAGIVAAGLTPVGPKLITASVATSKMTGFITEWASPDFSEFIPAVAILMVVVVAITWMRLGSRRPWAEILLLALATGWILLYLRTIAVGVVIAAPLVAGSVQTWLPHAGLHLRKWEMPVGVAGTLTMLAALAMGAASQPEPPLERMAQLNAALSRLPPGTVVYNDYGLGGWLEWRHRHLVPVVDGLTDAYEVDHVRSYVETRRLEPEWPLFLNGTGADWALLASDARLTAALLRQGDWEVTVLEGGYSLMKRRSISSD